MYDDGSKCHDWVEFGEALPPTMEGWIDLAINLLEVTEEEAEKASIHVSSLPWSGKDGITFTWDNDQE